MAVGDRVDFWSIDEKCWLSGSVRDINEAGQLLLCEPKGLKPVLLGINSRRLARHRHFTKEEAEAEGEEEAEAEAEAEGGPFEGTTRSMYGVPMYINFFGGVEAAAGGFNLDINELLGLIPNFRPFPF